MGHAGNKPRRAKRAPEQHTALSLAACSASVTDALKALDMAAAVLAAVVAHRECLPADLSIHAAQIRNLCLSAERGLREPNAEMSHANPKNP